MPWFETGLHAILIFRRTDSFDHVRDVFPWQTLRRFHQGPGADDEATWGCRSVEKDDPEGCPELPTRRARGCLRLWSLIEKRTNHAETKPRPGAISVSVSLWRHGMVFSSWAPCFVGESTFQLCFHSQRPAIRSFDLIAAYIKKKMC